MLPYEARRERLIPAFVDTVEAILVSRLVNVRYLTGFTGSNAAVLVTPELAVLATDGRYLTQAQSQAPHLELVEARAVAAALIERARNIGLRRVGIEASAVTIARHAELTAAAAGEVELVPLEPVVEPLRAVKDEAEIAALCHACEITDAAFAAVLDRLGPGVTERQVAWWLETSMREHGAEAAGFPSIVAFGPNSAIPHHEPTDRPLAAGDLAKFDFGARYDGYHADMSRTVVAGRVATWQRELYDHVAAIQRDCVTAAVVDVVPVELDAHARQSIEAAGYEVSHGLGHGVGLEIHEDPFLVPGSTASPLAPSMTITIEPGIYLPDQGGVRIEDTILIAASGSTSLTTTSRELIEVG